MQTIKMRGVVAAVTGALLFGFGANAMADSTDDILNALIAKGVLTEEEGALLQKGRTGEKEAAEKKKASDIKASFKDGIVWESGDKANSLKIGGRIHADYRNLDYDSSSKSAAANPSSKTADTFDFRRVRLEASGKFYNAFEYLISADFANATNGNVSSKDVSTVDQAWLNINYWKPLQVRMGQFKSPMNLEKITSSNNIDFMERSYVNQLAPNEDRGVMVHGSPTDWMTYALAVTTGEGGKNRIEQDPRVDELEYTGRVTANFAKLMENKEAIAHVGISGSSTDISKLNTSTDPKNGWLSGTSAFRTEGRGLEFLTLPSIAVASGISNKIERDRLGAELLLSYGPVKFQSEWMKNTFKGDNSATQSFNNDVTAYYAELLWLLTGENYADFYKDGAMGGIKPKNNFDGFDKEGKGAWEIGARYSKVDASDFKNMYGSASMTNVTSISASSNTLQADAWTVGLKWIPNPNTRFMLNYVKTDFDTPITVSTGKTVDNEKAITARAQWNF